MQDISHVALSEFEIFARLWDHGFVYSDSYDTSGGCTRVSGVERMLIRKNIGRGKIHEKIPGDLCVGDLWD